MPRIIKPEAGSVKGAFRQSKKLVFKSVTQIILLLRKERAHTHRASAQKQSGNTRTLVSFPKTADSHLICL